MVRLGQPNEDETQEVVSFEAGQYVFQQSDEGDHLFVVQQGEVELLKTAKGERERRVALMLKGDVFGEGSALEQRPRKFSARCLTACTFLRIDASTLGQLARLHPEVALHMMRRLSRRLTEAYEAAPAVEPADETAPPVEPAAAHGKPRIVLASGAAEFPLWTGPEAMVGRPDPPSNFIPEINLAPHDSHRSLSRRHALIFRKGDDFFVREETGVRNGTTVNGQKLETGVPAKIKNGDEICFGRVKTTFRA
jgi:hypothetical protein